MTSHEGRLCNRLWQSLRKQEALGHFEVEHAIVGECLTMCSDRERNERERQRRLHPLEVASGTERTEWPKADPSLTITEYSRPAAGKRESSSHIIRPPQVLAQTVGHIVNNVLTRTDLPWAKVYNFAFDRLRAIRQELVIQRSSGSECAFILEQCVRFHIYSAYRLCTSPLSAFDPKINTDHMRECLKRLLVLYRDKDAHRSGSPSAARIEMEACNVLSHLGSFDALMDSLSLPVDVRKAPQLVRAVRLSIAHTEGNFIRVKKLTEGLGTIELCCLHAHLRQMQRQALCIMNTGFSSRSLRFPTQALATWLMFDAQEEAEEACRHYGLDASDGSVQFSKSAFNKEQKQLPACKWRTYVEFRLESATIPDVIRGAAS